MVAMSAQIRTECLQKKSKMRYSLSNLLCGKE
jgi:hypothetical protein